MPIQKLRIEMEIYVTGERGKMTPGEIFETIQRIIEDHGLLVQEGKAVSIGPQISLK